MKSKKFNWNKINSSLSEVEMKGVNLYRSLSEVETKDT